jgi:hypothetical protein
MGCAVDPQTTWVVITRGRERFLSPDGRSQIDAEFRIESAGSLLVILSALPKLESSVGTVASPERTCVNPFTLAEAAFP